MDQTATLDEIKAILSEYSLHHQRTILNRLLMSVKGEQTKIDAPTTIKALSPDQQREVNLLRKKRHEIAFAFMDHPPSKKRANQSYTQISNEFDFVAKRLYELTENPIYCPKAKSYTKYKTRRKKIVLSED